MARGVFRCVAVGVLVAAAGRLPAQTNPDPEYDGKKASEWVGVLQNDASPRKRAVAVTVLAKAWAEHRFKDSLTNFGRSLKLDTSAAVRGQIAAVVGTLKPEDAKTIQTDLVESLKNEKESRVRRELAVALGRFPDIAKGAVPQLIPVLKDSDPEARAAAADALGRAGADAKAAADALLPLLGEPEKPVRLAAIFALGRIAPENPSFVAAALVKQLGAEKEPDMRRELLLSLGLLNVRTEPVVTAIAGVLADPDDETRRTAVRTLGTFGTAAKPAANAVLKLATEEKDKEIRVDAVRAFGSALGSELKGRVKELFPLLEKDPDFEVRLAVVEEIGALGHEVKDDKEVMAALRKRLSDPQVKVRTAAAEAIKRVEKPPPKPPEKKG